MIDRKYNKYISIGIIVLFSLILYFLTSIFFWSSDSPYFALKFEMDDTDPYRKMLGIKDLIESQSAHYMNWSGRFFCQSIVQVFCAFTTRPVFEICNILMWIIFLISSFKLTNLSLNEPIRIFILTSIFFFVFITLPLDPPFLVNYLWMGTIVLIWLNILLFNKSDSIPNIIWIFIFSVIAGNAQEAFSIPLCGALSIWAIIQRKKLMTSQRVTIIGFALGALILIIAPGNFVRFGLTLKSQTSIIHNIFNAYPQILISGGLFLIAITHKVQFKDLLNSRLYLLLILSIPFCVILGILMKFENLSRILIPLNIFLSILVIGNTKVFKHTYYYYLSISLIFIIVFIHEYQMNKSNYQKYSLITNSYHISTDGRVFLPDSLFIKDDGNNYYYNSGFVIQERTINPQKPFLKILPESLAKIKFNNDTNFIKQIGPQAWIFGQSVNNPQKITIRKKICPSILKLSLIETNVDLIHGDFLILDTINNTIISCHINNRVFLKSCVQFE